jgi:SET domain-containing protein
MLGPGTPVTLVDGVHRRPLYRIGAGVAVLRSYIPGAGMGLFAARPFRRGEPITQFDGTIVDAATARAYRNSEAHLSHARTRWAQREVIDGLRVGVAGRGGASLANDAGYTPGGRYDGGRNNSKFVEHDIGGVDRIIYLAAVRDIAAGEEITVSYGNDYWRRHDANTPSHEIVVIVSDDDDDVIDVGARM